MSDDEHGKINTSSEVGISPNDAASGDNASESEINGLPGSLFEMGFGEFFSNLESKTPNSVKSDLREKGKSADSAIDEINSQTIPSLLGILERGENERIKQQKPLRNWLLVFIGVQLLFFNIVVAVVILNLKSIGSDNISEVLDFLKFYVGASLTELLGMIWFITKSTFATTGQDIVNGLMKRISK